MKFIFILIQVLLILLFIGTLFAMLAPQLGAKPKGARLQKIKKSPQYKEDLFQNDPKITMTMSMKDMLRTIYTLLRGDKAREPNKSLPSQDLEISTSTSRSFLTWFGHSTFFYETSGKKILFDPMLGTHASPFPFMIKRYPYELPSSAEDLPALDIVIISHDHYDHLDYGTVRTLMEKTRFFVMPLGVGAHLERWGVPKEKIIELDWWEEWTEDGVTLRAVPSQHFSGRALTDRQKTLWAGWVITDANANVFFGGDSGYFPGFKTIGEKYGPFDLTLLDSGQYNTLWPSVHMFPEQSVQAHKDLQGKVFMPIHWSAFTLSLHSWTDPAERAVVAAEKEGIEMITPIIGERFDVLTDRPQIAWWREVASTTNSKDQKRAS